MRGKRVVVGDALLCHDVHASAANGFATPSRMQLVGRTAGRVVPRSPPRCWLRREASTSRFSPPIADGPTRDRFEQLLAGSGVRMVAVGSEEPVGQKTRVFCDARLL